MAKTHTINEPNSVLTEKDRSRFTKLANERGLTEEAAMIEATRMWIDAQEEQHFFADIRQRVNWAAFDEILADKARGETPRIGDELPPAYAR